MKREIPHYFEDIKRYGCKELAEIFGDVEGCCVSCHEDEDWGYDLIIRRYNNIEYEVCCYVACAFDDWLSTQEAAE